MTPLSHDAEALRVEKVALRRTIRRALSSLSEAERERAGGRVAEHLTPVFRARARSLSGGTVALFASLPLEIPTEPIAEVLDRLGLARALPSYREGYLTFHAVPSGRSMAGLPRDRLGIPTPLPGTPRIPLEECTLVLVPGLAFGADGSRLGQGGGYYDRALAALRSTLPAGDPEGPLSRLRADATARDVASNDDRSHDGTSHGDTHDGSGNDAGQNDGGTMPSGDSSRPLAIGIGFDLQRVPKVPQGPLDQRVDALCTPAAGLTYA